MAYAKTEHWERNYLINNWTGEKEGKYGGICFGYLIKRHFVYMEQQVLVPMIRLNLEHGRKQIPFQENRFHVMCGICHEAEEFLLTIMG